MPGALLLFNELSTAKDVVLYTLQVPILEHTIAHERNHSVLPADR
jgi:hypothetical protein